MHSITLRSPAKLNLILKVINKRPDGYHNLKTLFERTDLCADIRLTPNKTGTIRVFCNHPRVPKGPRNLVYRIAKILKEEHNISQGISINIKKRIPVAAGLGGGSSNAATVLLGLNRIWGLSLSRKKLLEYGRKVGSDVPFFLHNCSWGVGTDRGDRIRAVPITRKLWHVLVVPCVQLYSREVFRDLNLKLAHSTMPSTKVLTPHTSRSGTRPTKVLTHSTPPQAGLEVLTPHTSGSGTGPTKVLTKAGDNVNILIRSLKINNIYRIGNLLTNDLEERILAIYPRLSKVKERMKAYHFKGVMFSGSGPSVFGLVESKQEAQALKTVLKNHYKQVFVVGTL